MPIWDTVGLRATRSQLVSFDDTLLPADRRCRPPAGDTPNPIGTGLAWLSIGVAEAALDALTAHARGRVIPSTDQPLSHMQWVQFEVAEAAVALEASRLLAGQTMWLADHRSPGALPAAVGGQAPRQPGGQGRSPTSASASAGRRAILKSSPIQRHFRDAQAGGLMAYSVELCRDFIGKSVLGVTEPSDGGFG